MSNYKLIYFNSRGRAEPARLIFAQAEVDYEDKRVDKEEWAKLKPTTPTGALPLLEVDGKPLPGSGPITRFLAERFGLAGSNDFENAEIAAIVDVLIDFFQKMVPCFFEKDEEKKSELKKNLLDNEIPKYWGILEKRCASNKSDSDWIYGSKLTYADFEIFIALDYVMMISPNMLDAFPSIAKLKKAVESLPNIARWLEKRPETEH